MSTERNPLADLNFFEPQALRDAEALFGPIDRPTIETVLADPDVEAQVALLALTKSIRTSGDTAQNALVNRVHETTFGLLTEKAHERQDPHMHAIALYLASQAIGNHNFGDTTKAQ